MKLLRRLVNVLSYFFASILLLGGVLLAQLWPASWWLDVRSVRVFDSAVGAPVLMAVDRTIRRDFLGHWLVTIRRYERNGWVTWCSASGSANYSTESRLPDPLTMQWWTHPNCHPLPPGKYVARTTWTIPGANLLPDKTVVADSNIFLVAP